jgi:hypothetical protein
MPHDRAEKRLRFHRVWAPLKLRESVMKRNGNDWRLSRRAALSRVVLGLGATTIATRLSHAAAQQKISQADAKYQGAPMDDQRCDSCAISNRRIRANSFKAASARTVGASCSTRRVSRSRSGNCLLVAESTEPARAAGVVDQVAPDLPRQRAAGVVN